MTVKELIDKLSELPEDSNVDFFDPHNNIYHKIVEVYTEEVYTSNGKPTRDIVLSTKYV
jgi:hypothetical protein